MNMSYAALLPEIILMGGAILILLSGSFLTRRRQPALAWLGIVVLTAAAVAGVARVGAPTASPATIFDHSYILDTKTTVVRILAPLATAVVILIGRRESRRTARESETICLLLLATLGTLVLAGAGDLLIVATGFLLATVPLYALIGLSRSSQAAEATMKTYLLGAIFGVVMLLGIAALTAVSATSTYTDMATALADAPPRAVALGFVGVLAGLLFKAGAVPGHFWVPDAAESSGPSIAAFLTTVPKIGALIALARLVSVMPATIDVPTLIAAFASISMLLGTLAAFWQADVQRLLGWSTIGQVGFLLMPVAVINSSSPASTALLLYLVFYAVTNLTLFAAVAALPHRKRLSEWRGAGRRHPLIVGALIVGLLSLVGTPPTLIFIGKLVVFTVAWQAGLPWLTVLAAGVSIMSLFYALRWINSALRTAKSDEDGHADHPVPLAAGLASILGGLVIFSAVATLFGVNAGLRILP